MQGTDAEMGVTRALLLDLGQELRGGQRQVLYLAQALERLRLQGEPVEVLVACPRGSALADAVEAAEVPLLPLPGRGVANLGVLFALRRAIHRQHINVLHTHDARAASVGAWFKRWNPGLRLVHARRVSYPIRKGARSKKYHMADATVGVSHEISRNLIESGLDENKVHTIHSGIEPSRYPEKIERGDGRFIFGAVGALTEQKGFSVLIQAMSVLSEVDDLLPWEVRIIGEGPLFHELLELAESMKVLDRLALFGRQDSKLFLPYFDVMLVPSVNGEGSSAAIKEGWAVGLPVICSSLPSNEELVQDKESGLVVMKGNPLALSASMLRLMNEPMLRERLVMGGKERLKLFTAEHMAHTTLDLYRSLLAQCEDDNSSPSRTIPSSVLTENDEVEYSTDKHEDHPLGDNSTPTR